jgi:hypothetical protein
MEATLNPIIFAIAVGLVIWWAIYSSRRWQNPIEAMRNNSSFDSAKFVLDEFNWEVFGIANDEHGDFMIVHAFAEEEVFDLSAITWPQRRRMEVAAAQARQASHVQ